MATHLNARREEHPMRGLGLVALLAVIIAVAVIVTGPQRAERDRRAVESAEPGAGRPATPAPRTEIGKWIYVYTALGGTDGTPHPPGH